MHNDSFKMYFIQFGENNVMPLQHDVLSVSWSCPALPSDHSLIFFSVPSGGVLHLTSPVCLTPCGTLSPSAPRSLKVGDRYRGAIPEMRASLANLYLYANFLK